MVAVKVCGTAIVGLKLYSDTGDEVYYRLWYTRRSDHGKWYYNEIPDDQCLCGISINNSEEEDCFTKLQFNLATIANFTKLDRSNEIPKFETGMI